MESTISVYMLEPDNPQPVIIPAAVCAGIGAGIAGWIGIKIWSACLDIQLRGLTNKIVDVTSPPVSTPNPTGDVCPCQIQSWGEPLPILLEHSTDGHTWTSVYEGLITGEQTFVPNNGQWRISPMKIVATRDSMIVPPGTLETSVDLRTWSVLSVSYSGQTITPEPNHFYRIR